MDKETRDLSIQVYEKLGWDGYGLSHEHISTSDGYDEFDLPLYTSDYLLEKLPTSCRVDKSSMNTDSTRYVANSYNASRIARATADTPLKALLKLTLALSDTNTLKEKDNDTN